LKIRAVKRVKPTDGAAVAINQWLGVTTLIAVSNQFTFLLVTCYTIQHSLSLSFITGNATCLNAGLPTHHMMTDRWRHRHTRFRSLTLAPETIPPTLTRQSLHAIIRSWVNYRGEFMKHSGRLNDGPK
jgi:hypothetical protein